MQVEVVRRGGLAGVTLRGAVDTAALGPDVAAAGEDALRGLESDRPAGSPRHPDSFQYELTVVDGGARQTTVLDEAELSAALRPIVDAALAQGHLD
jgi:hypothetical protein